MKNTWREHFSQGSYSYRCKDCQKKRIAALIARTREALGLDVHRPV